MKNTLRFLVTLLVTLSLALVPMAFAEESTVIRASAFAGPTGMGMACLMESSDTGTSLNQYEFSIVSSPDQVTPLLVKGELDIACVPANLGAVLYNNTNGAVTVLAVNTLGVLYIVSHGEGVSTMEDLRGRTIYASGKGSTPEYALTYALEGAGLGENDVTVEWKSEHAEALAAFIQNKDSVALLPQPFVTAAAAKCEDLVIAIDLNTVWNELAQASGSNATLITGCVIARTAFVEEHPDLVQNFLTEYAASVDLVNADYAAAAEVIGSYGIVDAAIAEKALPYCHIVCVTGNEMKDSLSGYFAVLLDAEPASVGGTLPGDDFYYNAE